MKITRDIKAKVWYFYNGEVKSVAKYKDIAEDIRSKIKNGEYTFGQKLPYEYVLCMSYHCNKETMKKALDILVKEGLIIYRRINS